MTSDLNEPVVSSAAVARAGALGKRMPAGEVLSRCSYCSWSDDEPLPPKQAAARYKEHARACPNRLASSTDGRRARRHRVLTDEEHGRIVELVGQGVPYKQVADEVGCALPTVRLHVHQARAAGKLPPYVPRKRA